jgi:Zn-dependent peptidase ImmA (M78 family)
MITRSDYYESMREAARSIRLRYGLEGPRVMKSHLRQIYRDEGVRIVLWPRQGDPRNLRNLRGVYTDDGTPTVMIARKLPAEQQIFTMGHELKHHLFDRRRLSYCDLSKQNTAIEIAAEVFAAELIFPQQLFIDFMERAGIEHGQCTKEDIVRLKMSTGTTLSYAGLIKSATRTHFCAEGAFDGVKFVKLQYEMFGEPLHKVLHRRRKLSARVVIRNLTARRTEPKRAEG